MAENKVHGHILVLPYLVDRFMEQMRPVVVLIEQCGIRPAVVSQRVESALSVHVGVGPSVGVGSFPIIEPVGRKKRHPLVFLVGIHSVVAPCVGIVVHVYSHKTGAVEPVVEPHTFAIVNEVILIAIGFII